MGRGGPLYTSLGAPSGVGFIKKETRKPQDLTKQWEGINRKKICELANEGGDIVVGCFFVNSDTNTDTDECRLCQRTNTEDGNMNNF